MIQVESCIVWEKVLSKYNFGEVGFVERGKEKLVYGGGTGGEAAADYSSSTVDTPMQH